VGLVAGVAGEPSRVIGGCHLGESLGFGAVGFVASGANHGGVEFRRLDRGGIVGVPGQSSVAGFAGNDQVAAQLFLIDDVGVAGFADFVSGVGDGAARDLSDGVTAIVSVLAEAVGDNGGAEDEEGHQCDHHDSGEPDEVFDVLEQAVSFRAGLGRSLAREFAQ